MKSFKPWLLVMTGIVFNIFSAVITHYFIGQNNDQINRLEQQINQYDTLIESQWRTKTEIDRQQEFLLLLLNQGETQASSDIHGFIDERLSRLRESYQLDTPPLQVDQFSRFNNIIHLSKLSAQKIIDSINNTYLEKIEIQEKQTPIETHNARLYSIAIFLQVSGLILVLARDIRL